MPKLEADPPLADPVETVEVPMEIPRQSWREVLALVPRRSLWKAVALLALLVAIVLLQRRSEVIVRQVSGVKLTPPVTAPASPAPATAGEARP